MNPGVLLPTPVSVGKAMSRMVRTVETAGRLPSPTVRLNELSALVGQSCLRKNRGTPPQNAETRLAVTRSKSKGVTLCSGLWSYVL